MKRSTVERYENFYGHFSVQICASYNTATPLISSMWQLGV